MAIVTVIQQLVFSATSFERGTGISCRGETWPFSATSHDPPVQRRSKINCLWGKEFEQSHACDFALKRMEVEIAHDEVGIVNWG